MSKTILEYKQRLTKPSEILRHMERTGTTQGHHELSTNGEKFCAVGAMMKYFGWDGTFDNNVTPYYNTVSELLGTENISMIENLNDIDRLTFGQIANLLEEYYNL